MKCDKCNAQIENGEEREHQGRVLCEDCYINALSTVKPCDPWAVYAAKSFSDSGSGTGSQLTRRQKDILAVLNKTNGIEPEVLAEKLGLPLTEVQHEMATLRHMEKVRAAMEGDKRVFCLW